MKMQVSFLKKHSLTAIIASGIFYAMISGCVPKPPTEAEEDARAKAIADSLRKVHERKCQIALSTAFEYFKNKEYTDAIRNYLKIVDLNCGEDYDDKLWLYLGNSFREVDNNDSAMWAFQEGLSGYPEDIQILQNVAYLYAVKGDIDKQIESFETIVRLDSSNIEYWKKLHDVYFRLQDYENDKRVLGKIIKLDPEDVMAKNDLVTVISQLGEDPTHLLEERWLNTPENPEFLLDYANVVFESGDYEKALELYQKLVELDPGHLLAYERIVVCYKNLDNIPGALDILKKLLEFRAGDKNVLYDITELYMNSGQLPTAYEWANKTIEAEPKDGRGYYIRALVLEEVANRCIADRNAKAAAIFDKLTYELALEDCRKGSQLGYGPATGRLEFLEQLVPTKGDIFMHAEKFEPKGECYDWIKRKVKR